MQKIIFVIVAAVLLLPSCKNKQQMFEKLSPGETSIKFQNKLKDKKLFGILYYLYYYNGAGVGVGDVNNDGLPDIYFSANSKGNNKLYLNKGDFKFEDITKSAGVGGSSDWCTGVSMADINGDGYLDIYVSSVNGKYGLKGHNELFINNKNNTFTERSHEYGLDVSCLTTQTAFFDYDHDGDLDCYILNQSDHPHSNITDTSYRNKYDSLSGDRLYRNDLNTIGKFTDVSKQSGIYQSKLGYGLGIAVADLNNDGWEDIYIGNDFHENDYYYVNQQNGTFKEEGAKHFRHYSRFSMGNDIADFNNDGQLDVATLDMLPPDEKTLKTYGSDENFDIYNYKISRNGYQEQVSRNCLQMNNGNAVSFSDVALISGVASTDWSWSPLFADFDNDGNKDLFISNGIVNRPVNLDYIKFISDAYVDKTLNTSDKYDDSAMKRMPDGASSPFLFRGSGGIHFSDVSKEWGTGDLKGYFNGAAYADLNNDGKLDMVINCLNAPAIILKNKEEKRNYLSITFKGTGYNTFGIGAKAYLFNKGKMQYQQLMQTRGFMSSVAPELHFGIDSFAAVDSIVIVWPSQKYQVVRNVKANQHLQVKEENSTGVFVYNQYFPQTNYYADSTEKIGLSWRHQENNFIDFNKQYLIPHMESTRGPKIAVADVNNDGLDDFYACGAKRQPGALMIQNANGTFTKSDTAAFAINAISEDVDAVFFDANNDGFKDLWVVSGGNEFPYNELALEDRLYLNDGHGHFKKSPGAINQQYENKTCIAVADIDKDGDSDVFIGNIGSALEFGKVQPSYLYMNDGNGVFSNDYKRANFNNLGMVTSACFADVNNDSWPDLIVTGEFMSIKIFLNNKGSFKETVLPESTGLWQTLCAVDVNGDGFTDILAGNWGYNSKLWAGKNGPLKLYVKDFDFNGSVEQILCYTIDGKEYTFLAKDELEKELPVLKKYYLNYDEVAGKTVQYTFYDLFKNYKEYQAELLASSCFLNNGKGGFTRVSLPDELQFAPIMKFTKNSDKKPGSYIAAGNFFGVIPYEGRYDALLPTTFSFNKQTNSFIVNNKILSFNGEARDIKWLNTTGGEKMMVIARNNNSLLFYK